MTQITYYEHATNLTPHLEFSAEKLFELAITYSVGRNVPVDRVQAHKFFNLAALKGVEIAKKYRKELSLEMAKEEISKAQKEAREWLAGKFQ